MPRSTLSSEPKNLFGFGASVEQTVEPKVAGTAIATGDVVVIDPTDTQGNTVTTTTTADSVHVYGVAVEAASQGEIVYVARPPSVVVANTTGTVAAGDLLATSGTAGALTKPATPAVGTIIAVALTAAANNKATVRLKEA